jgi:hypothetical protein
MAWRPPHSDAMGSQRSRKPDGYYNRGLSSPRQSGQGSGDGRRQFAGTDRWVRRARDQEAPGEWSQPSGVVAIGLRSILARRSMSRSRAS